MTGNPQPEVLPVAPIGRITADPRVQDRNSADAHAGDGSFPPLGGPDPPPQQGTPRQHSAAQCGPPRPPLAPPAECGLRPDYRRPSGVQDRNPADAYADEGTLFPLGGSDPFPQQGTSWQHSAAQYGPSRSLSRPPPSAAFGRITVGPPGVQDRNPADAYAGEGSFPSHSQDSFARQGSSRQAFRDPSDFYVGRGVSPPPLSGGILPPNKASLVFLPSRHASRRNMAPRILACRLIRVWPTAGRRLTLGPRSGSLPTVRLEAPRSVPLGALSRGPLTTALTPRLTCPMTGDGHTTLGPRRATRFIRTSGGETLPQPRGLPSPGTRPRSTCLVGHLTTTGVPLRAFLTTPGR